MVSEPLGRRGAQWSVQCEMMTFAKAFAFSFEIEGPETLVDAEAPTPEEEPLLNDMRGLLLISLTLELSLASDTFSFLLSSILS